MGRPMRAWSRRAMEAIVVGLVFNDLNWFGHQKPSLPRSLGCVENKPELEAEPSILEWMLVKLFSTVDCGFTSAVIFMDTLVIVYLDKTMELNTFNEMFFGLINPKHEAKVKDILVFFYNGIVETLVKNSLKVLPTFKLNSIHG
ncbi:hypothetical protein Taro_048380 [Colocasia esculenta]|uniref:Uncharacterized protein n=1 Tax=Colocasia esculenta TaxID=4460 RepID=A0A843X2R7_COLES|nr:hypothetical protein [Colocasia esculenta]